MRKSTIQPLGRKSENYFSDVLFYYTFFSLLVKSCMLVGFISDKSHTAFNLTASINNMLKPNWFLFVGPILFFLSFSLALKGRVRMWYLFIINTFFSFLFLVDLWYLRGFTMMPSLLILQELPDLHHTSASIFSMGRFVDLLFFIDLIILLAIFLKHREMYRAKRRKMAAFMLVLAAAVVSMSYIPVRVYLLHIKDTRIQLYSIMEPNYTASNISPIGYHLLDAVTVYQDSRPLYLTAADRSNLQNWFNANKEGLPDNKYKGMFRGKNLLLIQVESLEKFVINQSVNGQEITPNLNRLIKNGLYFTNMHEQVNEGTTSDAELMANTSVYPLKLGSTFFRYPYTKYNSLPKLLGGAGYSNVAIHADKASFWNWKVALTSIGYQKCVDQSFFVMDEVIGMGLSDGSLFRQSVPIIRSQKQPFLSYIITMTSHGPFDIPDKYRELNLDKELDKSVLGGYFQSIHYTDRQIGFFLDELGKSGLLDNTVVAVYGDHEGPHKYYRDEIMKLGSKQDWWLENYKLDPFIIYHKDLPGEEIKVRAGEIDILPTLCYVMGIDTAKYRNSALGRNILNTGRNFVVLQPGNFISEKPDDTEKQHALKGLDIAEMIIKSNYFKSGSSY